MAPRWFLVPLFMLWAACSSGIRPGSGRLEIHHLAMGQADATLIVGPTGKTLLVDAGEPRWDGASGALRIGAYVEALTGRRHLDTVLLTHFHVDHTGAVGIGGLWHLVEEQGFTVGRTLHRDTDAYLGRTSATASAWRAYLMGEGREKLAPEIARVGTTVDLGPGVVFRVVATDEGGPILPGRHDDDPQPPDEDDYSIAAVLRFGAFDYFIGGDLSGHRFASDQGYSYHDVEHAIAPRVGDVDVYRANHHGSFHASSAAFLAQLAPRVTVISVGDANPFGHPSQATLDRLAAVGTRVFLTGRGQRWTRLGDARVVGDVVIHTDGWTYDVAGESFTATDPRRVDADGDGWFREADPDDGRPELVPPPWGGCDPVYERCP